MTARHVTNAGARFAQIPEALLYDSTVSSDAVRVYGVLQRHGDDPANCYPSYDRIATLIGRSPRSVPAWITELERLGWVERVPRAVDKEGHVIVNPEDMAGLAPTSNGYIIHDPPRVAQRVPPAPASAPKESHVNESHINPAALQAACEDATTSESNPRAVTEGVAQVSLVLVEPPLPVTDRAHPLYGWDRFMAAYPKMRNGKRPSQPAARDLWRKMPYAEKSTAYTQLGHYAAAVEAGDTPAMYVANWLKAGQVAKWGRAAEFWESPAVATERAAEARPDVSWMARAAEEVSV